MTDREKAIVMAYTGVCMLDGEKMEVFYRYLEELYGRPVYTHEWLTLDIKERSLTDFLELCKEAQPDIIRCKDCKHKYLDDMVWNCPFGLPGGENFFCGYGAKEGEADEHRH